MGKMYHWFSKLFFNWLIRGLVASNVLYIQTLPYLQKWIYRLEYRGRKSCLLYPQVFIRFSKNCYWNFGQAFNQWNLASFLTLYTFLRGCLAALDTSRRSTQSRKLHHKNLQDYDFLLSIFYTTKTYTCFIFYILFPPFLLLIFTKCTFVLFLTFLLINDISKGSSHFRKIDGCACFLVSIVIRKTK